MHFNEKRNTCGRNLEASLLFDNNLNISIDLKIFEKDFFKKSNKTPFMRNKNLNKLLKKKSF